MSFDKSYFIHFLLALCFFCVISIGAQENHKFEHIDLPTEQIDSKASCILEDSKGFIWFGFDNGLVVYDGYKGKKVKCVFENGVENDFINISSILEDANGKIWVGTQEGVFVYDPISKTSVYLDDSKINGKTCRSLSSTSKNEILIGTSEGLLIYNLEAEFLEQYTNQPGIENSLSNDVVRCSYEDKSGNIWIGTYDKLNFLNRKEKKLSNFKLQLKDSLYHSNNLILFIKPLRRKNDKILVIGTETGLCLFNTFNNKFSQYSYSESENSISNSVVKSISKVDNKLWLGTDLGLNVFDFRNKIFTNYYNNFNNSFTISNNVINDLYFDSNRNLWIATDTGVDKIYLNSNKILINQFSKNSSFFKEGIIVNDFSKQNNGDIWFATQQGVFKYDSISNLYEQFLPPKILHNKIRDIVCDDDNLIWMATSGGLNIYDSRSKEMSNYVSRPGEGNDLKSNYLTSVAKDSKGTIWIGTFNKGLFKVVKKDDGDYEFINFKHRSNNENSLSSNSIYDIAFDEYDNVWIATGKGINCFYTVNGVFERFSDRSKFGEVPYDKSIHQLTFDEENSLWMSSFDGLFQWNSKSEKFTYYKDLPTNVSSSVVKDSMVYFTAQKKLFCLNKNTNNVYRVSNIEVGLNSINNVKLLNDNTIVLIGGTGFAALNLKDLKIKESASNVKWTDFYISHTLINPYTKYNSRYILKKNIDETETINLNYDQNSFRVDFSSFPFNSKDDVEYKYILENYEDDWSIIKGNQNFVSFTQVRAGTYKLRVKASNNQGLFNGKERVLNIIVKPPKYLSWWAFLIYFVGFVLAILFYRRILLNRERVRSELKFEKLEHQKSDELIKLKTRFFTNITHELKTPLTLISSPVDDLLTKQLDEDTKKSLSLVKRNTDRLKKLVNQILDIRKIEAGGEKLRIQKYDIIKFCEELINQFKEESLKRNIFLHFSTEFESLIIWLDVEKVEKIVFNLLSNAFKFTPDNGIIKMNIERESSKNDNYISISVSDTGSGISKKDQTKIFDRFNNLSSPNYTKQRGTGIGLSLIYEYAALHNGTVKFESVLNVGSKFIFSLPKRKSLLKDYEIVKTSSQEKKEKSNEEFNILENEELIDEKDGLLKALIVDDDADIRDFLNVGLNKKYKIVEAEDGQEAFKIAIKELPDIIISDLMMPNVDGIEFCKKLKSDIRTSHIPFILLTAKSGIDSKISGIEIGADDYIQKPFNLEHLKARIKNLIKQRESLKRIFLQQIKLEPSEITVNSIDEKFLDDLLSKIELEIDNSELSVKSLSEMLGMSSTNLYRKVKALTGQTANEFIRNMRLKRAAQLLKYDHLNVSEVMYMVGFTHHSYFTRCFKELFGVSPKDYKK